MTPFSVGGSCILCPAGARGFPGPAGPPGRDGRDGRDAIGMHIHNEFNNRCFTLIYIQHNLFNTSKLGQEGTVAVKKFNFLHSLHPNISSFHITQLGKIISKKRIINI